MAVLHTLKVDVPDRLLQTQSPQSLNHRAGQSYQLRLAESWCEPQFASVSVDDPDGAAVAMNDLTELWWQDVVASEVEEHLLDLKSESGIGILQDA
ncbi:hypothetical protein MMC26_005559 [Xylographa opegraphella]|nr:hypothetical protein [Xylographa opegraphella]